MLCVCIDSPSIIRLTAKDYSDKQSFMNIFIDVLRFYWKKNQTNNTKEILFVINILFLSDVRIEENRKYFIVYHSQLQKFVSGFWMKDKSRAQVLQSSVISRLSHIFICLSVAFSVTFQLCILYVQKNIIKQPRLTQCITDFGSMSTWWICGFRPGVKSWKNWSMGDDRCWWVAHAGLVAADSAHSGFKTQGESLPWVVIVWIWIKTWSSWFSFRATGVFTVWTRGFWMSWSEQNRTHSFSFKWPP